MADHTKYPKGSEWKKWDLHIHTPSSYDYEDKSITNEAIIEKLKESNICVVAITDHHIIDVTRINKLRQLAGDDLTILAGIELRSELGGSESIHFIGIFPQDSDTFKLENAWIELQGKFQFTPDQVEKKGDDKVYCDLKEVTGAIQKLGGIITIHAGSKANSIEKITNALPYKEAQKEEVASNVDIFEMGKVDDLKEYHQHVFPSIKRIYPMIICSDNHNIRNYELKSTCWIKADPTFEGLKQIVREPEDRVYIGEMPPKLGVVNKNKTRYIGKISVKKEPKATHKDIWFNNDIEFNSGLVAIIGNKGKGKSALAEMLGLLGSSKNCKYFSFLNDEKFRKNKLANNFYAEIEWLDGSRYPMNLMDTPDMLKVERVNCIPQNYLEILCNNLDKKFQEEIDDVVFSHIDETDRIGRSNLKDLIDYKTQVVDNKIKKIQEEIIEINKKIIELENQLKPEYSERIENKLHVIIEELRSHYGIKPDKVPKPESDMTIQTKQKKLYDNLTNLNSGIKTLEEEIKNKKKEQLQINNNIEKLNIIKGKIKEFENRL
ncbi:MAG: hypothetical protein QME42_06550 [bacterium]|nr:hypothetical protein [bacterium]